MNKFKIGDRVVAIKGFYKNIPSRIINIEHINGYEPVYYLDGFMEQRANTIESNLRLVEDTDNFDDCEHIEPKLYIFADFDNIELGVDMDPSNDCHNAVPHIHYFKEDITNKGRPGWDIHYEYGGALSIENEPRYVFHDKHYDRLSSTDISAINNWLHDEVHWNYTIEVLSGSLGLDSININPVMYSTDMPVWVLNRYKINRRKNK